MSPKILPLAAGLVALGLSLPATRCVGQVQEIPTPAPMAEPIEPGPPAATTPKSSQAPTVLLLSNGQVLRGEIVEEERHFIVRQKLGDIRRPRLEVEATFATMADLYAYKKKSVPANDPDERMSLARWCLENGLDAEAASEVKAVIALMPGDKQAKSMLYNLQAAIERKSANRDAAVLRTSAEMPDAPAGKPGELNLGNLRAQGRKRQTLGPPVILDLPQPIALQRYREFAKFVHPQLQRACANCHNEQSTGTFQLVQVKSKLDNTNEFVIRANLDAALRLVDPRELAQSEILRAAILPHPPTNRPVLHGPNDPAYRNLYLWVSRLKSDDSPAAGAPSPGIPGPAGDGFASGRTAPEKAAKPGAVALPIEGVGYDDPAYTTDPNFRTVSPLVNPGMAAPLETVPPLPMPGKPGAKKGQVADPTAAKPGPDGKPVGPDGKPIPEMSSKDKPKDRKAKTFDLDLESMGPLLRRGGQ